MNGCTVQVGNCAECGRPLRGRLAGHRQRVGWSEGNRL